MTTKKDETVQVNPDTGEIATQTGEQFIAELAQSRANVSYETEEYVVSQGVDRKFSRKAKYKSYSSIKAESRADKLWLLNILEGDEEMGNGLKSNVGKELEIQNIILRPYDRINENDGSFEYGVLTYLITPEKEVYVTSAKAVYFSITRIMELFGTPDSPDWENIKIKVLKEKMQNGDAIKIKMIG